VGTASAIETFRELHEIGLFAPGDYADAFRLAGLDVSHDKKGLFGRGMYVGAKPS